jgi:hypothetical protein
MKVMNKSRLTARQLLHRRLETGSPVTEEGALDMYVISRKNGESVVVGSDDAMHRLLKVTVLEIDAGKVKLGIEVDSGVSDGSPAGTMAESNGTTDASVW